MPRLHPILASLKPKTLLPLVDLLLVNAAVLAGLWLWTVRDDFRVFNAGFVLTRTHWFLAVSATWLLLAVIQDFYQRRTTRQLLPSLTALLGITGLLLMVYFVVYFFAPRNNTLPRGVVLSIAGASFLFVGAWRLAYFAVTTRRSREALPMALRSEWQARHQDAEPVPGSNGKDVHETGEPAPLDDKVLTVQEVADHLKVSQATIWRWCKSGRLPAYRVGQQWRIRAADLQAVMDANMESIESIDPS